MVRAPINLRASLLTVRCAITPRTDVEPQLPGLVKDARLLALIASVLAEAVE